MGIIIDQKEYLKKYLGKGGRKKKSKKPAVNRFTIVDDDIDVRLNEEIKIDLAGDDDDEEAPQIVQVIDDRPHSLMTDEVSKTHLWQPIGAPSLVASNSGEGGTIKFQGIIIKKEDAPKIAKTDALRKKKRDDVGVKIKEKPVSPESAIRSSMDNDQSPPRGERNDDLSPPRRSRQQDRTPPRQKRRNDDLSPPRRSKQHPALSPPRNKRSKNDLSPPRKSRHQSSRKSSSRWSGDDKMSKTLDGKKAGLQNAHDLIAVK